MNPLAAKKIFLWNVPAIAGGDPDKIADILTLAGFESVAIKCADGPYRFTPNRDRFPGWGENVKPVLVETLRARGLKVIGWGFNYGLDVGGEAAVAVEQIKHLGLDGWDFDAESRFDAQPGAASLAYSLASTVRNGAPDTPLAACGWAFYRNPRNLTIPWHPQQVMESFLRVCDAGIPMMYWDGKGAASASTYARASLLQWRGITNKMIIPAGRAYTGDGGTVDAAGIAAFAAELKDLPGLTWWSLEHAIKMPDVWTALSALPGKNTPRALVSPADWMQAVDAWAVSHGYGGPGVQS